MVFERPVTKMVDDDRLITLVKKHDLIYNRFNPNYKYLFKKRKAWASIAAKLGVTVQTAMLRYRTLRDRYVHTKRSELLRGSPSTRQSMFMKKMEFLSAHIFNKSLDGSIIAWDDGSPKTVADLNSSPCEVMPLSTSLDECSTSSPKPSTLEAMYIKQEKQNDYPVYFEGPDKPSEADEVAETFKIKMERDIEGDYSAATYANNMPSEFQQQQANEALYGFGRMILATLSSMNKIQQAKAMLRVAEAVMQISMEPEQ